MGAESQRKTGTAGPEEAEGEPAADAKAQGQKCLPEMRGQCGWS